MTDGTTTTTAAAADTTASAAAAASTAAAKPWFEGKASPEDIGHWENKGWKKDDPADVALQATKQARELQRHFGVPPERLLKLPERADDAAGWATVNARLGVPEKADGYDFAGLKHADGKDVAQPFVDAMRTALHEAGVRKDAARDIAQKVIKFQDDSTAAQKSEVAAARATQISDLQKQWGNNLELNKMRAAEGAKRLGLSPEAVAALEGQMGYSNLMEAMRKIGVGTSEDTFEESGGGGNPTTANGAKARLSELQGDAAWAKKLIAGDATVKREFNNLMMMIYGDQVAA